MKPKSLMIIAGETSGDILAAELVQTLRQEFREAAAIYTPDYQPLHGSFEPHFFGAGGPHMSAAGVEVAFDLTRYSAIGLPDVLRKFFKLRRIFHQLFQLAASQEPDAIICVDYAGFNRRFGHAIKQYVRGRLDWFHDWNPKLIQYVSPQVWASREGRAYEMARDFDLLLSILPFEKAWYAKRVPQLRVEWVGDPIVDRHANAQGSVARNPDAPSVLLLPGSRAKELERHLPVMLGALEKMKATFPKLRPRMVLPNQTLAQQANAIGLPAEIDVQTDGLATALTQADVAIASTGTVTRECAWFGVPTVAIYKTAWATYQIGRRIVKVKFLAMPNLLAGEEIFPEFIQDDANAENIARAAIELLRDAARRNQVKAKLTEIREALGKPGASQRAARAIVGLLADSAPGIQNARVTTADAEQTTVAAFRPWRGS